MRPTHWIRRDLLLIPIILLAVASCRSDERRRRGTSDPPIPPQLPPAAPAEADRLRKLALDVQMPSDAYAEADAIRRLRQYIASKNMTYTTRAVRTDTDAIVESPSASTAPMRVHMEVFRGREHLYSFTFEPRDNRNLALLGQ